MADTQFQPKIIQVPSVGNIQFPGDMPDDQISAAIQKNYPQLAPKPALNPYQEAAAKIPAGTGTSISAGTQTFDQAHPQPQAGPAQRFAQGAGIPTSQSEAVDAVRGMLNPQADPSETDKLLRAEEQIPVLGGDFRARAALSKRADKETGAVGVAHRIASYVPLAGPAVTAAQDEYDKKNYAGALGAGLNALFSMEGLKGSVKPKPAIEPVKTLAADTAEAAARPPAVQPQAGPITNTLSKVLGGGEKAMAKRPLPQATAAGNASNADVAAYAKSKGIDLLPGQATGAKGLQTIQAIGERAVVAPGELPDVLEKQKANFGNLVDDFKTRVGASIPDTEAAGSNLKTQAQAGLDDLKQSAQADYQAFQQQAGDIPVDLADVKAKAAASLASQAEALKNVPAQYANPVRNVLKKLSDIQAGGEADPKTLKSFTDAVDAYGLNPEQQASLRIQLGLPSETGGGAVKMSTAQQLRSAYLDISRDYSGNVPKSVQRYAAQAAKDIDAAMTKAADQAGATQQWRQANAKWKQLQQTYNNPEHPLYKVMQEPDPSKVPTRLLGKGNYGGSPQTVRQLQQAGIDTTPLKREVAQQIADKNFALTNGGRGLAGYSSEFLKTLFSPAEFDELTKMGRVGRAIRFEMNPSGTSNVLEGRHQIMGILHGTVGATVGPLASRLTTSKALSRAAIGDLHPTIEAPPVEPIQGFFGGPSGGSTPPTEPGTPPTTPNSPLGQMFNQPERRTDLATRKTVAEMTPEERAQALLTSDKTGLPNRRAFEESQPAKAVAMSDADGLKAVNDKFGYSAGDALLKAKADALQEAGVDAYHDKGDEFLYRGDSPADLQAKLDNAREILRNKVISVEMKDGRVLQFKGADFSYGTGQDLQTAETGLKANKAQREAAGQRARGELRGITQVGPEAGKENLSGVAQANNGGIPGADQQSPVADLFAGKPQEKIDLNAPKSKRKIPPDVTAKADYSGQTVPAKAPTFFSKAERVAEEKLPNTVKADQVMSTLQNAGVKADELKWLGLDDYLKGKDKVSKADLLDHIRQNNVQVKEVMKGSERTHLTDETINGIGDYLVHKKGLSGGRTAWMNTAMRAAQGDRVAFDQIAEHGLPENLMSELQRARDSADTTKFSNYQLPGGENYRELLLTLPEREQQPYVLRSARTNTSQRFANRDDAFNALQSLPREERLKHSIEPLRPGPEFKSSHFDEPNVLAHIRFNDRVDAAGKKTLFMEELQSDWHQKGRKQGYAQNTKGWTAQSLSTPDAGFTHWEIKDANGNYVTKIVGGSMEDAIRKAAEKGVPDAPFKSTWHELAMKRMLRYAAENGYDQLAWTTGEQQAARYDLSKHVEAVRANLNSDGTYQIGVKPIGKNMQKYDTDVPAEKLPDVLGKDLADKIISQVKTPGVESGKVFSGLDLKVGGSGMKGFYNKILPDFANKYGKKWGAKVGETTLDLSPSGSANKVQGDFEPVHAIPITPAMRKDVIFKGQPIAKAKQPLESMFEGSNA